MTTHLELIAGSLVTHFGVSILEMVEAKFVDDGYEQALIEWAHTYNGYERIARSPEALNGVVQPLLREFNRTRKIPEWAGVDLLRGWAFYIARAHRFSGGWDPIWDEYPEFVAILDAIDAHPNSTGSDRPPRRAGQGNAKSEHRPKVDSESRNPPTDRRDFTRFRITVNGEKLPAQAKRHAVRTMIEKLVQSGVTCAALVQMLSRQEFRPIEGLISDPASVQTQLAVEYPTADPNRWFCDSPILDRASNRTFVVWKMWGANTETTLQKLATAFPDSGVGYEVAK
ncbi:hypothetical protein MN2019_21115 [Mycolicibacterium neoaurum]|uniref:hypothetical protein n=1 Tax=Mycolicibacterium neoaurum TaxID=1795 RepID=UPI001BCCB6F3|nr:hypothetical protein [Mycolicibacterium neoaurum]QVI26748.1 hypothetical protein MN2019_21115 [Mycolicibacterium neoaurum]